MFICKFGRRLGVLNDLLLYFIIMIVVFSAYIYLKLATVKGTLEKEIARVIITIDFIIAALTGMKFVQCYRIKLHRSMFKKSDEKIVGTNCIWI